MSGLGSDVAVSLLQPSLSRPGGFVPQGGPSASSSIPRRGQAVSLPPLRRDFQLVYGCRPMLAPHLPPVSPVVPAPLLLEPTPVSSPIPAPTSSQHQCQLLRRSPAPFYSHHSWCHTTGVVPEPQRYYIFLDTVTDSDELSQRLGPTLTGVRP
jgi:hypothetical protein